VLALAAIILSVVLLGSPTRRRLRATRELRRAQETFHREREWLEARFLKMASQSGKPRGLRWVDCEFENEVAFARDRNSGHLRALVGVTILFEAVEGGEMDSVAAVHNAKAATVLFRLDGPKWEPDSRAYFNLNPDDMLANYPHELELVGRITSQA
jgi:hypothetical protein